MTQTSTTGGRPLGLMALRAASKAAKEEATKEEATKEMTMDAWMQAHVQQGLDLSASSGG